MNNSAETPWLQVAIKSGGSSAKSPIWRPRGFNRDRTCNDAAVVRDRLTFRGDIRFSATNYYGQLLCRQRKIRRKDMVKLFCNPMELCIGPKSNGQITLQLIWDYRAEVTWPDHAALLDRMLYRRSNISNYCVHIAQIAKHYTADVT